MCSTEADSACAQQPQPDQRGGRESPSGGLPFLDGGVQVTVRELIRLIEHDGWSQVRQSGSHRQFHHATKPGTVTVSGKLGADVPPGTLNSALKQAGLK